MTNTHQHVILNVDDDEGARYAKTKIFERAGYLVLEAENGSDALKLVHQKQPHLVLLDVGLPDINGMEVCKKNQGGCHHIAYYGSASFRILHNTS